MREVVESTFGEIDVSVIIPTKDRLWSLPKAVASARSDKLRIQIIVMDDGSSDGTAEWLQTQPDIEVVEGQGWGKPWGVNKAVKLARGRYIRFLDSDDWLNPGATEEQFEMAERDGADVVVAGCDFYDDETPTGNEPWVTTDDFIAQQIGETVSSTYLAFLFRRSFVEDIPHRTMFPASDFASRDDRCFMLEVALKHPKVSICEYRTVSVRQHKKARLQFQGGLKREGTLIQQLYIYKQILALLERRGELTVRRRRAAAKMLWPLAHWIAYTHIREGADLAAWIYQLDPEFTPPEPGLLGRLYRTAGFAKTEKILRTRRQFLGLLPRRPQA
ncbi:MAG TPA: glycosyltransferase family 2 protein [Chthoniobacterales bacterium]|jgi:glycosyltransferase involved in cell wall biosynthesis|nr:glycosyltransferase family 2 protein [Chthoniobacterales bacterium]